MKRLEMHNGTVYDADPDRCPECGRLIEHVEQRGDAKAYVHRDKRLTPECIV